MEVVHEGILELGYNGESRSSKDWKGRLFVLKRHPTTGRSSLDFYKSTSKRWQKQSIMGVLSLWPEFEISLAHQCPYKYTLKLSTAETVVYLASNNQGSMNKWLHYIQSQRILNPTKDTYIYNVKAQESNSANMIGIFGECQLALCPNFEIVCANVPSREVVAVWPLDCLRTFSYGNGIFSFEAGRLAPQGPGEYAFITSHDHLIHGRLLKLIDKYKRNSSSSNSSSRLSSMMDSRPPARLPVQDRDSSSDSPGSGNSDGEEINGKQEKLVPPPLPELPPPKIPPKGASYQEMDRPTVDAVGRYLQSGEVPVADETGDHVYSHTLHSKLPEYNQVTVDDPQIYNSLLHEKQQITKPSGYEMAYPQRKSSVPKDGSSSVVYDTAYNETDGRQHERINVSAPVNTPQPIVGSVADGMTANPLYGSKGNLLEDIMSNQVVFNSSPQSESPPLPPKPKSLSSSPESNKLPKPSHPDVTANPVYITSTSIREESRNNSFSPPFDNHSPPLDNSTTDTSQKENLPDERSSNNSNYIKGYSKVNKHITDSFQETFIPGSMDSDPPPIPDRQGSFNDD